MCGDIKGVEKKVKFKIKKRRIRLVSSMKRELPDKNTCLRCRSHWCDYFWSIEIDAHAEFQGL